MKQDRIQKKKILHKYDELIFFFNQEVKAIQGRKDSPFNTCCLDICLHKKGGVGQAGIKEPYIKL